jgi:hypothetical protein
MSRVDLMKEAIQLAEEEKKIAKQLPVLMWNHLKTQPSHQVRQKELEEVFYPMFQRNIFLQRYIQHIKKK